MTYNRYYLLLIIFIIGIITFSCSKNSTGIADIDINFPNTIGYHWTYERYRMMEQEYDTVDVEIFDDTTIANKAATLWSFDYHCILDTVYLVVGNDTLDTVIACVPPPDTCITVIKADSVTQVNKGFFSFDKFVIRFPLSVDKSWNWDGYLLLREHHTSQVISIDTMTVKGNVYNDVYEIRSYHDVAFFENDFDYIRSVYWFVNGVGIIKMVESKIDFNESTMIEEYVEIIDWELMEATFPY